MDPIVVAAQVRLDGLLPEFMTTQDPRRFFGSTWVTIADVCVTGRDASIWLVGPLPVVFPHAEAILPAGSRLRYVKQDVEMLGYGYCAGIWSVLEIETGDLAASSLSINAMSRKLVTGAVARETMAAILIVPEDAAPSDPAAEVAARQAVIREIVADLQAPRSPLSRP